ncbi:MAG: LPXTG cell wall anchor domain-containing protein, partial [Massilioclostridium sp.]|nr:LPXTG cell wall anchor domain-containing protein [Massilioclostridium sp.]
TYAVEVSRDADGHLVADPAEVVFVVKAVGTGEPTDPGEPADPENPSTPDNTDPDTPKTGDSSNYLFWSMILLASGGILATLIVCRRKQRKI